MGDRRFRPFLDAVLAAGDRAGAIYDLPDEGVIQALAALCIDGTGSPDPVLANVLATEALNRMERARVLFQNLGEGVLTVDERERITSVNPAGARLTGHAPSDLYGRTLHEALASRDARGRDVPPDESPGAKVIRTRREVLSGSADAFRRKDGALLPIEYTAAPILRAGEVAGAVVVFRDRTGHWRERLRSLLEAVPVGVSLYEPDGRLALRNGAARALWGDGTQPGHASDQARLRSWRPDTGEALAADSWPAARALATGEAVLGETRVVEGPHGARRALLLSAVPLRTPAGIAEGVVAVDVDVTDRMAAEAQLRQRERLHDALVRALDEMGEGVVLASSGRIVYANDAFARVSGYPVEELLQMPSVLPLVAPAYRDMLAERMRRREAGEDVPARYGAELLRRDGTRVPVEVAARQVPGEEGLLVVALVRDVAARDEREAEAWRTREHYRLLVENVREYAIFMLDPQGNVMTWNPGAERIKGYTTEEILGRGFEAFYTPEDKARGHPAEVLRLALQKGQHEEEAWRQRKDGSRFFASVVVTPLRDDEGRHVGFANVTRDLTGRLRQERLQRDAEAQAERSRELEAFGHTVAHDLRAPLRGMLHLAEFIERDHGAAIGEEGRRDLRALRESAHRMGGIVEDLLRFARSGTDELRLERVDLSALAREILTELAEREPTRDVQWHVEDGLAALADPGLARVILSNLLDNAWKFSRHAHPARIHVGQADTPRGSALHVRDNGAGFDPARTHDLFQPFRRLHRTNDYEGTGVGLATVRRIVERHGGAIWAEGEPGKGATFWLMLPKIPENRANG